jgi:hypothetical protein
MKIHIGGPFRGWRSRLSRKHASPPLAPPPPGGDGQTSSRGNVADAAGCSEILPSEAGAGRASVWRAATGDTVAAAMQLAIGLLTASLDSPELEAWALPVLIPRDADGLGDLMAGLHLISELVIRELHEATGEPPEAILQRLAILAEHRRGLPSTD